MQRQETPTIMDIAEKLAGNADKSVLAGHGFGHVYRVTPQKKLRRIRHVRSK